MQLNSRLSTSFSPFSPFSWTPNRVGSRCNEQGWIHAREGLNLIINPSSLDDSTRSLNASLLLQSQLTLEVNLFTFGVASVWVSMYICQPTFIILGLSVLAAASDEDVVSFPAIGEVDVVFPREDTYAVEAPFPVIFGLQNAPVLTTFSGTLN